MERPRKSNLFAIALFLSVSILLGCVQQGDEALKGQTQVEITKIGSHRIIILSEDPQHDKIVEIITRDALRRAEETFCDLKPQSLLLFDFSSQSNPTSVLRDHDHLGNDWISMPFYLKNLTPNPTGLKTVFQKNVEKNIVLQHEIGHLVLASQFPQDSMAQSDYGSNLPDWVDEMAAMLHDGTRQQEFRNLHFHKIMDARPIISPTSLIALTRDQNPWRPKLRDPGKKIQLISLARDNASSDADVFDVEVPIEEYYTELAILLSYFKSVYGESCLVDRFISGHAPDSKSSVRNSLSDLLEGGSVEMSYRNWIIDEFDLNTQSID